jgi:hypothetical protein
MSLTIYEAGQYEAHRNRVVTLSQCILRWVPGTWARMIKTHCPPIVAWRIWRMNGGCACDLGAVGVLIARSVLPWYQRPCCFDDVGMVIG